MRGIVDLVPLWNFLNQSSKSFFALFLLSSFPVTDLLSLSLCALLVTYGREEPVSLEFSIDTKVLALASLRKVLIFIQTRRESIGGRGESGFNWTQIATIEPKYVLFFRKEREKKES